MSTPDNEKVLELVKQMHAGMDKLQASMEAAAADLRSIKNDMELYRERQLRNEEESDV